MKGIHFVCNKTGKRLAIGCFICVVAATVCLTAWRDAVSINTDDAIRTLGRRLLMAMKAIQMCLVGGYQFPRSSGYLQADTLLSTATTAILALTGIVPTLPHL
ncbi:hypothetical protein MRX96_026664 [Rhipicephalus microplus]